MNKLMRYVEIVLKLTFLITFINFSTQTSIVSSAFDALLITAFVLGFVLTWNKNASYNFRQTKRDLIIRKIEGVLLMLFALIFSFVPLALF